MEDLFGALRALVSKDIWIYYTYSPDSAKDIITSGIVCMEWNYGIPISVDSVETSIHLVMKCHAIKNQKRQDYG